MNSGGSTAHSSMHGSSMHGNTHGSIHSSLLSSNGGMGVGAMDSMGSTDGGGGGRVSHRPSAEPDSMQVKKRLSLKRGIHEEHGETEKEKNIRQRMEAMQTKRGTVVLAGRSNSGVFDDEEE